MKDQASVRAFDFFEPLFFTRLITLPTLLILSQVMPQQPKSATMLLNEHEQRGHEVVYREFECAGHTANLPKYGCTIYVNGGTEGTSQNHPNKKAAREAAAQRAVDSLILF